MNASCDEDVKGVIDDAMKKYGRLDFYFANAGIGNAKSMAEQTKEEFLEMMTNNAWRYGYLLLSNIEMYKVTYIPFLVYLQPSNMHRQQWSKHHLKSQSHPVQLLPLLPVSLLAHVIIRFTKFSMF